MKIAAISDLHGYLPKEVEPCDLLLICGDIIPLHYQNNLIASESWIQTTFLPWCRDCSAKNVVFIAGNHDWYFERRLAEIDEMMLYWRKFNVYYLKNTLIEIEGIKIFGTPYCKMFGHWAFMREPERLKQHYSEIPKGLDILISHDAPKILDLGVILDGSWKTNPPTDAGNPWLAEEIMNKKPKYSFCGHIHSGNHAMQTVGETTFANVSYVDEGYHPTNPILYFDYEKSKN